MYRQRRCGSKGALVCPVTVVRDQGVFINSERSRSGHHVPVMFRCAPPASLPPSLRHRLLLPFPGGVACALKTRLWQFCPDQACSICTLQGHLQSVLNAAAPPLVSLRPCHGRPCNSALAASTTACSLQSGCHDVPRAARSRAISESVGSSR